MPETHQQPESSSDSRDVRAGIRHLAPSGQPASVHEISEALYRPFTDHGSQGLKFHISGCHIDPIPFVRLDSGEYRVLNGQAVSTPHAESLGLADLVPLEEPPASWIVATQREEFLRELDALGGETRLAKSADGDQEIIWCNHLHGTLSAETADASIEIPFSMWAARLARGLDKCPPWHCPITGIDTYQLAVDDEGTISDAASILTCPETGRRLLKTKLALCALTGQMVEASELTHCPVCDHDYLNRLSTNCQACGQQVDSACTVKNQCRTCRDLGKIRTQDFAKQTGMADLIETHRWLDQVQKIKLGSQPQHWMLQFALEQATWRVLFEKESGAVVAVARSTGWLRPWKPLGKSNWPGFLQV